MINNSPDHLLRTALSLIAVSEFLSFVEELINRLTAPLELEVLELILA